MIFTLKNLRICGYVDEIIIKLIFVATERKEPTTIISTKAEQKTQDKIDFWTKNNVHALKKMGWIYNKIV